MVIHFDNRLPDPMKLADLLQQSGSAAPERFPDRTPDTMRVIAAYDCEQLIGFGSWDSENGSLTEGSLPDTIVVLPQYQERSPIDMTISKLLHARKYSRPGLL
ncbi:hypothetical protein [Paenibacillus sp. HJGM_3]|uniref:hypothetical protein n=1 Tax=Paenibacillus sp. HJGM_3 TaxID=3379816 RepID=UPI00385A218B